MRDVVRSRLKVWTALVVLLCLVAAACGGSDSDESSADDSSTTATATPDQTDDQDTGDGGAGDGDAGDDDETDTGDDDETDTGDGDAGDGDCAEIEVVAERLTEKFGDFASATGQLADIAPAVGCERLSRSICLIEDSSTGTVFIRRADSGADITYLEQDTDSSGIEAGPILAGICRYPVDGGPAPAATDVDAETTNPVAASGESLCSARAGVLVVRAPDNLADAGVMADFEAVLTTKIRDAVHAGEPPTQPPTSPVITAKVVIFDNQLGAGYAVVRYEPALISPHWLAERLAEKHGDLEARPASIVGTTQGWAYSPETFPQPVIGGQLRTGDGQVSESATDGSEWLVIVIDSGWVDPELASNHEVHGSVAVPGTEHQWTVDMASDLEPSFDIDDDGWQDWIYGHGAFVGGVIQQHAPAANFLFVRPSITVRDNDNPALRRDTYVTYFTEDFETGTPGINVEEVEGLPHLAESGEFHPMPLDGPDDPVQVVFFDELQLASTLTTLNEGLERGLGQDRRLIVNMSMGFYQCDAPGSAEFGSALKTAFETLMMRLESTEGYFVAAAGNEGQSKAPFYPAAWAGERETESAYAVGSIDDQGGVSGFSNHGDWVNIYAQGENVTSYFPWVRQHAGEKPVATPGDTPDDGIVVDDRRLNAARWSGTSFAAPCVTAWLMVGNGDPDDVVDVGDAESVERPVIRCWEPMPMDPSPATADNDDSIEENAADAPEIGPTG